jgi:hypothetical protein
MPSKCKVEAGLDKNDIDIINVDWYWVRALLNNYATIESDLYLAIGNALHPLQLGVADASCQMW